VAGCTLCRIIEPLEPAGCVIIIVGGGKGTSLFEGTSVSEGTSLSEGTFLSEGSLSEGTSLSEETSVSGRLPWRRSVGSTEDRISVVLFSSPVSDIFDRMLIGKPLLKYFGLGNGGDLPEEQVLDNFTSL